MLTYKGMEIVGIYEDIDVIVCYDGNDVGNRYKIFKENENRDYNYIVAVDSPITAFEYIMENLT